MKNQPTNEQILKKIKELITEIKSLDERLCEVEWVIERNKHYNEGHLPQKFFEEAEKERNLEALQKKVKEREEQEEEDEEGSETGGQGQALEYIDEMDFGDDLFKEVGKMVNVMAKSKIGQKPEFKGPLDALRKMTK